MLEDFSLISYLLRGTQQVTLMEQDMCTLLDQLISTFVWDCVALSIAVYVEFCLLP